MQILLKTVLALGLLINHSSVFANEPSAAGTVQGDKALFTSHERQLIKIYVGMQTDKLTRPGIVFNKATLKKKQEQGLPPGLVEKKSLPAGVAVRLQPGNTLPPDLVKSKLPPVLEQQLSALPEGYERTMLDDLTIVLIETASNRVADVVLAPGTTIDKPQE